MGDTSGPGRRREPRYPTRHRVEGESLDRRISLREIVRDLCVGGCCLHPDQRIPPGTPIEIRCDISGIGLQSRGDKDRVTLLP